MDLKNQGKVVRFTPAKYVAEPGDLDADVNYSDFFATGTVHSAASEYSETPRILGRYLLGRPIS